MPQGDKEELPPEQPREGAEVDAPPVMKQPLPPQVPGMGLPPGVRVPAMPSRPPRAVKQPLPPEQPRRHGPPDEPVEVAGPEPRLVVKEPLPPEASRTPTPGPSGDVAGPGSRPVVKEPLPPEMPDMGLPPGVRVPPLPSYPPRVVVVKEPLPPEVPRTPAGSDGSGWEWWRSADVRGELRDAWSTYGREGWEVAVEVGARIGEAITARLPDPYAAGQQRGLDLRWLRLGLNVPALAISLLVSWGGRSPAQRTAGYVAREGLLAPLGWVLLPALVLAALSALPFAGVLGAVVGVLARGAVAVLRRAWAVPYLGYVLRLAVAVAAWSFVLAAGRLVGRVVITWLTGV